jgi:hypothetical protein
MPLRLTGALRYCNRENCGGMGKRGAGPFRKRATHLEKVRPVRLSAR